MFRSKLLSGNKSKLIKNVCHISKFFPYFNPEIFVFLNISNRNTFTEIKLFGKLLTNNFKFYRTHNEIKIIIIIKRKKLFKILF